MKHLITLILSCTVVTITAFSQPGTLDSSFGTNGTVVTEGMPGNYYDMALQNDGKIILAGTVLLNNSVFQLIRYNSDGTVDRSFGIEGRVVTDYDPDIYSTEEFKSVAVQSDGKIVGSGSTTVGGGAGNVNTAVLRYNPNGSLDSSFGENGVVIGKNFERYDNIEDMALQPDGKIVVTGNASDDNNNRVAFFTIRYLPDGHLDESFGDGGIILTSLSDPVEMKAVVVQSDGKIVIGGEFRFDYDWLFIRYLPDGSLDREFGVDGQAIVNFKNNTTYNILNDIALQENGRILGAGGLNVENATRDMMVIGLESDGQIDTSFGENGIVTSDFGERSAEARAVLVQRDGKIVAAGREFDPVTYSDGKFAVARYLSSGGPDVSFGEKGMQTTGIEGSTDPTGAALQEDGKIVVAGDTYIAELHPSTYGAIARYIGDRAEQNQYVKIKRWLKHHGFTCENLPRKKIKDYIVERSSNGSAFTEIGRISNNQNSFADPSPLSGTNYYRLATVSQDGSTSYSNIIAVEDNTPTIKIYPNPATKMLNIEGLSGRDTRLVITNLAGNVMARTTTASTRYSWNISDLKKGNYILTLEHEGKASSLQFVKE